MRSKHFIILLFFTFILSFLAFPAFAESAGISPIALYEDNLLRGSIVEKEISLSHTGHEESFFVEIIPENNEIKDWIYTDKGNSFIFPAESISEKIIFKVLVPEEAELGSYTNNISIVVHVGDSKAGNGVVGVNMKLLFEVKIKVTDEEFINYEIKNLHAETEDNKVRLRFVVDNTGNVPTDIKKVKLTFYPVGKTIESYSYYHELTEEENIKAFTQDDLVIEMKNKLDKGEYWVHAEIFSDKLIAEKKVLLDVKESRDNLWRLIVLVVSLVLILIFVSYLFKKYK